MPAPALRSLAKKAGKSMKDAERYYSDAKKQRKKADKDLTSDDYRLIMGIVKKRLGLAEAMIQLSVEENDDYDVRVFRDLDGEVSFATMDDVHINPEDDVRVAVVHRLANNYDWPHNSEFPENIEGYEGSVNDLTRDVIAKVFPGFQEAIDAVKPRRRTLAQKQGARAGVRTRERRMYTEERLDERAGYLMHNYYYAKNNQ